MLASATIAFVSQCGGLRRWDCTTQRRWKRFSGTASPGAVSHRRGERLAILSEDALKDARVDRRVRGVRARTRRDARVDGARTAQLCGTPRAPRPPWRRGTIHAVVRAIAAGSAESAACTQPRVAVCHARRRRSVCRLRSGGSPLAAAGRPLAAAVALWRRRVALGGGASPLAPSTRATRWSSSSSTPTCSIPLSALRRNARSNTSTTRSSPLGCRSTTRCR